MKKARDISTLIIALSSALGHFVFFLHSTLPPCPQPLLVRSLQLVEVWPYTEKEKKLQ